MTLLEGMASGLPIVATRVGAVPELVLDGVTGFLVPSESPEALAQAIQALLASPELRDRFGAAGRRRIEENYSAARMTSDYLAVYQRALRRRTGSSIEAPVGHS
jgi:glycosyltransferase involved in cell wall biosynthesis